MYIKGAKKTKARCATSGSPRRFLPRGGLRWWLRDLGRVKEIDIDQPVAATPCVRQCANRCPQRCWTPRCRGILRWPVRQVAVSWPYGAHAPHRAPHTASVHDPPWACSRPSVGCYTELPAPTPCGIVESAGPFQKIAATSRDATHMTTPRLWPAHSVPRSKDPRRPKARSDCKCWQKRAKSGAHSATGTGISQHERSPHRPSAFRYRFWARK